jgi:hypothetical protein
MSTLIKRGVAGYNIKRAASLIEVRDGASAKLKLLATRLTKLFWEQL